MGTFMDTNKKVVVKPINSSRNLELDAATTLSFYISERIQDTEFTTIDYKVDVSAGRDLTEITPWTGISQVGVTNDVYEFDYTVTGVTASTKLQFTFRTIDIDGLETLTVLNDFKIIN